MRQSERDEVESTLPENWEIDASSEELGLGASAVVLSYEGSRDVVDVLEVRLVMGTFGYDVDMVSLETGSLRFVR